jgi:hypothetical protein
VCSQDQDFEQATGPVAVNEGDANLRLHIKTLLYLKISTLCLIAPFTPAADAADDLHSVVI